MGALWVIAFSLVYFLATLGDSQCAELQSSVSLSDRIYVCYGETVSYSCVTQGAMLTWNVNGSNRASFEFDQGRPGDGAIVTSVDCYQIVAVLFTHTATHCYSTLFVTFGQLNESTAGACQPEDYKTFPIFCRGINQSSETLYHEIAAVPDENANAITTCAYIVNRSAVEVNLDLNRLNDSNTDVDYYKIALIRENKHQNTTLLYISDINPDDSKLEIFNVDPITAEEKCASTRISINVMAVDKCGQRASPMSMMCACNGAVDVVTASQILGNLIFLSITLLHLLS